MADTNFNNNPYQLPDVKMSSVMYDKLNTLIQNGDYEGIYNLKDSLLKDINVASKGSLAKTNAAAARAGAHSLNINNILFETAYSQAVNQYEQTTGNIFIPKDKDHVAVALTDIQNKVNIDDAKKKSFEALTSGKIFTPLNDGSGNFVYTQDYEKWKSGDTSVKTVTPEEKTKTEFNVAKTTGFIPGTVDNKKVSATQDDKGNWTVGGVGGFKDQAEAEAAAKVINDKVDAVITGDWTAYQAAHPEATAAADVANSSAQAANWQQIDKYASNMNVDISSKKDEWNKAIANGSQDYNSINAQIKEMAKIQYAGWGEQFDKGLTVQDIASNYISQMSKTLEIDPTSISLNDPTIQSALSTVGTDGKPTFKPLWQFERELKSDPRYYQTNQSHNEMASLAGEIGRTFGMI